MNILETYLAYVEPFQGSKRFNTWAMISVISAVLERRCWFSTGGLSTGKLYPNQYIVLVGSAGDGKTSVANTAMGLLKAFNATLSDPNDKARRILFGPDKFTPAAILKRFKASSRDLNLPEGKFTQSALYLFTTEFSTMIKDIGGGALGDDLLKLYDCDDSFSKELVSEQFDIPGPCCNLLACTTPDFLSGFFPHETSGTGFTSRTIFAVETGYIKKHWKIPPGDPLLRQRLIHGLGRVWAMRGEFKLSQSGEEVYKAWHLENEELKASMNRDTIIGRFYARKHDHVKKVAMALSAGTDSSRVITDDNIQQAINLINEAEPFMDKCFGVTNWLKLNDFSRVILANIPELPHESEMAELIVSLHRNGASGELQYLDRTLSTLLRGGFIIRRIEGDKVYYGKKA